MADLSKMTAVAEVYESDVERLAAWVHAGPVKAEVKNPALPHPLNGEVKSDQDIARMIAKNQVFAMGPREDADRRVVQVTVHLDNAAAADRRPVRWTASDRHTGTEQVTPFSLAWSNLGHKRGRTAIAAGGVAFAVILIFMELGLLGGVSRTATMLYDNLHFDLLLLSSEYLDLSRPGEFPRERLAQARAATGVDDVLPLHFGVGGVALAHHARALRHASRRRRDEHQHSRRAAGAGRSRVPHRPEWRLPERGGSPRRGALLGRLDSFLFDRRSKPEFGDYRDLMAIQPDGTGGDEIRLNGKQAVVVGCFELGTGFSWNGMLMSSEETFDRFLMPSESQVNFGLVQLKPGADADRRSQRELRAVLPHDVQVLTRDEINARSAATGCD